MSSNSPTASGAKYYLNKGDVGWTVDTERRKRQLVRKLLFMFPFVHTFRDSGLFGGSLFTRKPMNDPPDSTKDGHSSRT